MRKNFVLKAYNNADLDRKELIKKAFPEAFYLDTNELIEGKRYRAISLIPGCQGFGHDITGTVVIPAIVRHSGLFVKDYGVYLKREGDGVIWRVDGKFAEV